MTRSYVDLPTSRAQRFFFFWKREKPSAERERAGAPPPEPEMRSEGLLRKSTVGLMLNGYLMCRKQDGLFHVWLMPTR